MGTDMGEMEGLGDNTSKWEVGITENAPSAFLKISSCMAHPTHLFFFPLCIPAPLLLPQAPRRPLGKKKKKKKKEKEKKRRKRTRRCLRCSFSSSHCSASTHHPLLHLSSPLSYVRSRHDAAHDRHPRRESTSDVGVCGTLPPLSRVPAFQTTTILKPRLAIRRKRAEKREEGEATMRHHGSRSASLPRAMPWLFWLGSMASSMVGATPYPKDDLHDAGFSYLMPRNCESYCGVDNQFCCLPGQVCTTLPGDIATCLPGAYISAYVSTWTETFTTTIMTHWIPAPVPTPGVDCIPQAPEQEACGRICCAGWQQCAYKTNGGQCTPRPGYGEPTAVVVTTDGHLTTQYAAPYRVIGTTVIVNSGGPAANTATSTAAPTSTGDGSTIGADGINQGSTGGGLSPGAIAGIVIGTLAGVALLMLLCFCCIARGVWTVVFGKKKTRDEKVIVEEKRYSHRSSRVPPYSQKDRHAGWMGRRPTSAADRRPTKKSDGKWWLGIASGATALLALLNIKKKQKPVRKSAPPSRYSDSYIYSDETDVTTNSSSSGGRTHRTGQTGRSYRSRDSGAPSYASRVPSRRP